jgi:hypothetical protein
MASTSFNEWPVTAAICGTLAIANRTTAVPAAPPAHSRARFLGVLTGMRSGFASMIAHAGTPPFRFYVMPKKLDRDIYVGRRVLFSRQPIS